MELKIEKLTPETFEEFGTILNPNNCGESLLSTKHITYFPDKLPLTFAGGSITTISVLILRKVPYIFDTTEFHNSTEEIFGGFDADVIFHTGAACKIPDFSKFKAFILPKFYWVRLKRKIFHFAPFVIDKNETLGWVLLPPFTYINDSNAIKIKEPIKIKL